MILPTPSITRRGPETRFFMFIQILSRAAGSGGTVSLADTSCNLSSLSYLVTLIFFGGIFRLRSCFSRVPNLGFALPT